MARSDHCNRQGGIPSIVLFLISVLIAFAIVAIVVGVVSGKSDPSDAPDTGMTLPSDDDPDDPFESSVGTGNKIIVK